jgi:hypothetical protein
MRDAPVCELGRINRPFHQGPRAENSEPAESARSGGRPDFLGDVEPRNRRLASDEIERSVERIDWTDEELGACSYDHVRGCQQQRPCLFPSIRCDQPHVLGE